jgi:hypothetical protein
MAQSNKPQLFPKPANLDAPKNSRNCTLEKTEEAKISCAAEEQATYLIKKMKVSLALANKDSITMTANSFCEDGKREQCIQTATDEALSDRLRKGKALMELYQPIVALILEAHRNVTDRQIPEKQASQYLNDRIIEAFNKAVNSNQKTISQNKPKNEIVGSKKLQKRNQNIRSVVGGRRKPTRLVKRSAAILFGTFKSVVLGTLTFAASMIWNLLQAAIAFVKMVFKTAWDLMVKAATAIKNFGATYFAGVTFVRPLSGYTWEAFKPILRETAKSFISWGLPLSGALFLIRGWVTDPRFSPIENIYGVPNAHDITSFADAENECKSLRQVRYDDERKFTWHLQCETKSYYRYIPEKKKFLRFTDDQELCHSDETFECVSSLSFSFSSIDQLTDS